MREAVKSNHQRKSISISSGNKTNVRYSPTPPIHSGDEDKVEASTEQKAGAGSQALQQSSTQAEPDRPWACLHCPKAYKTRADLNVGNINSEIHTLAEEIVKKHNRNSICGKKHNSGNVLPPPARVKVSMDWTCPRCGSILISKYSAEVCTCAIRSQSLDSLHTAPYCEFMLEDLRSVCSRWVARARTLRRTYCSVIRL